MDRHNNHGASVVSSDFQVSSDCERECNSAVVSFDTLPGAENFPLKPGDFKIPRVLAEFVVQIDSEAVIRLNEPAYEIKRIEKEVFLTQCRFIPPTNKVFLEGYIRKNIEYAARTCSKSHNSISGTIKDTTVHVPFRVFTKVDFEHKPLIMPNPPAMVARYFDEKRMGKNMREADRSNVEIFNEPVFCELEWSAIYDADINEKGRPIDCLRNEEEFDEFTDKSVVFIAIKLLQKQQVCFPHPKPHDKECDDKRTTDIIKQWEAPIAKFMDNKSDYDD